MFDTTTPLSFAMCMSEADKCARLNATVRALCHTHTDTESSSLLSNGMEAYASAVDAATNYHNSDIGRISAYLSKELHADKFIPLLKSIVQSSMAVALYAGDGIIVKITEKSHHSGEIRPYGLPAIHTYDTGRFMIGVFPWVNTQNITEKDVEEIKEILKKHNLRFRLGDNLRSGDARPDNIGRLPDGSLVVLDGNAVEFIDKSKGIDSIQFDSWMNRIRANFPTFYPKDAEAKMPVLRENVDFTFKFSPLIKGSATGYADKVRPAGNGKQPRQPFP